MNENLMEAAKKTYFTPDTAKAASDKAAQKRSAEAKARKKMAQTVMDAAYAKAPVPKEKAMAAGKLLGKRWQEITVIDMAIYERALRTAAGDMESLIFFRDMLGEKPADKVQGVMSMDMNFDFVVEPEPMEEPEDNADDHD